MIKSLVFFDSRVTGFQILNAGLGPETRGVLLDAEQDGVLQMRAVLAGYSGLESIHVVSHGSPGALWLGSTVLDQSRIGDYAQPLQAIGQALAPSGDLLLYGCNVAAGEAGRTFIAALASATGAEVAASSDATGAAAHGGDSVLEEATGSIEAAGLGDSDLPGLLAADGGVVTTDFGANEKGFSVTLQPDGKILVAGEHGGPYDGSQRSIALARYNANGTLDTSFDSDGKVTTAFGSVYSVYGNSVTVQSDGKILVAGNFSSALENSAFALVRYHPNGSLDTSFDSDGKVLTDIGEEDFGESITVQADGKILVAGSSETSMLDEWGADLLVNRFALTRYNANGSLDASFDGDGRVITEFEEGSFAQGASVTLQEDGKIIVAGIYLYRFALARYNADGSLDTSFSSDGLVTTSFSDYTFGQSVTIQANGKILVAGYTKGDTTDDFALARYNANGSLDTSFDGDGRVTTDFDFSEDTGASVTVQGDGKIVVAGTSNDGFALARYNVDGSLDISFGSDGLVTTGIATGMEGSEVTIQADGKILVAGTAYTDDFESGFTFADFALARYNPDGSLDTTFGNPDPDPPDREATGTLSVAGTAREGGTLTASLTNVLDADGATSTAYQWQISDNGNSGWSDLGGAGSASVNIAADQSQVGKFVRVAATTTDILGGTTAFTGTAYAVANVNDAPTGGVTISGTATLGSTLTAANTLADADGLGTVRYQWLRGASLIAGATNAAYVVAASDVGQSLSVRGAYTDGFGTAESVTSPPRQVGEPAPGIVYTGATDLRTTEAGGTAAFQATLQAAPRHEVILTLSINDATEGLFSATGTTTQRVTFTAATWNIPQSITVAGRDDRAIDGDITYAISTAISSDDLRYDRLRVANLDAINTDDDAPDEWYGDAGGVARADLHHGGNGASDLYGLLGRDELYGGNGNDRLYGGYGDDVVFGEADDDELEGAEGNDKLDGGAGNDKLTGGTGRDTLLGGDGNDELDGSSDADSMDGGKGADKYYVDNARDVVNDSGTDSAIDTVFLTAYLVKGFTLGTGIDNGELDALATNASLVGNAANNKLTGNASNNSLTGGGGADTLNGAAGNDTLYDGSGNDSVAAGDGNDTIVGGNGAGNDRYSGGAGSDTVKYTSANASITVNLATGLATGLDIGRDTLSLIEQVIGGKANDLLTGNTGANTLTGGSGNDTVDGGAGSDSMIGGDGSDRYHVRDIGDRVSETNASLASGGDDTVYSTLSAYTLPSNVENLRLMSNASANGTGNNGNNTLYAGAGNNVLDGSSGTDTASYLYATRSSGSTGVTLNLSALNASGQATASGVSGTDRIKNIENITGSNYNDTLTGNSAANVLNAGSGNDSLAGGAGNDNLLGGAGQDRLTGGSGRDTFDFNALSEMGLSSTTRDVITDFARSQDRIDLSTLDANTARSGNQSFSAPVVGNHFSGAFTRAGELYFDTAADVLYGNTDADAAAEFSIQITGLSTLSATDLIL